MKIIALILVLLAAPASAAECFHRADAPSWTMTYDPRPVGEAVFVWVRDGKKIELGTYGAGTGTESIYAMALDDSDGDDPKGYLFDFSEDGTMLTFDGKAYKAGCK